VSALALRRSGNAAVLQRDGFEKLVASIDEKVAAGKIAGEDLPAVSGSPRHPRRFSSFASRSFVGRRHDDGRCLHYL
jgi:hypothetical protein